MSAAPSFFLKLALAGLAMAALAGCTYDYLQRTDTVSYHAGDAVRANLEAETTNPARRSIFSTAGLGRNGNVIPSNATAGAATGATPAPTGASAAAGSSAQVN
ncbi:MAG TPA: hypothetical protein VHB74_07695 [Devosia sp.]|nr:hypothetical protein [Devosia sp.]